ncbi:MAG: aminopeptidase P family protein, partial [Bacteroidota bacterium]
NSNTYYLSGLDQEEVILVLFPDAPLEKQKEMLFIRKTNEHIQIWEGWKYSKDEAKEASGVKNVMWYGQFEDNLRRLLPFAEKIYLDINENERGGSKTPTAAHRLAQMFQRDFPAHQIRRAFPILADLRAIKSEEEITQMQTACDITEKAFRRVLGFVRPGVHEFEIEAEIQHEFLRNRATGPAYSSIIASGKNACVLHYVENKAECQDGELILMDFGAEYGNYSADLSRTIPVNGVFSPRQKDVYNAVLRVMKAAREMLVVGNNLEDYHKSVGDLMTKELIGLNLITEEEVSKEDPDWPAYKKYFMHGTSHFLGLDTHDVGNRYAPFEAGMVFTCEPGIYIPEENLGVRIENDILITADGPKDLMARIPLEVDEIEKIMAK